MVIAKCVGCGQLVQWHSYRGSRIGDASCPVCGGAVKNVNRKTCVFHPETFAVGQEWLWVKGVGATVACVRLCEECMARPEDELNTAYAALVKQAVQTEPVYVPKEVYD